MNTYTITFSDNDTVVVRAHASRIRDGVLQLATDYPNEFNKFLPIANIFEWTVSRGEE